MMKGFMQWFKSSCKMKRWMFLILFGIVLACYGLDKILVMKEKGLDIMHLERIINVRENIKDTVVKTPLLYSNIFSEMCKNNVYMKCENLQLTGAYKLRGALNKIISLYKFLTLFSILFQAYDFDIFLLIHLNFYTFCTLFLPIKNAKYRLRI